MFKRSLFKGLSSRLFPPKVAKSLSSLSQETTILKQLEMFQIKQDLRVVES